MRLGHHLTVESPPTFPLGTATADLRRDATRILDAALRAVDPYRAVLHAVRRDGELVLADAQEYDLGAISRVLVVGAGKASARMARALEELLGPRITGGVIVVKDGYTEPLRHARLVEAGHPLPDARGERGAREVLDVASGAGETDLVICCISGGGSALLPLPVDGVTLEEMVATTDLLLRSGGSINDVNAVRKHLSRIAGGQLARAATPAAVLTLLVSDVVGNPVDVIASGPTAPDPTTYGDAISVLDRRGLRGRVPASVVRHLLRGQGREVSETPKPGDPAFERVQHVVVASVAQACDAASREAASLGYNAPILSTTLQGEAREVARDIAWFAQEVRASGEPAPPPCCLVFGGETTVTVRGPGTGGRNQELALAAALDIEGTPDTLIVAFATDGTDGPTDAAGAAADGTTLARARALGLDPNAALARNDAYPFFAALGDLLITGPTNTNVNDLILVLVR